MMELLMPFLLLLLPFVGGYVWFNRASLFPLDQWPCDVCNGQKTALRLCLTCNGMGKISRANENDVASLNEWKEGARNGVLYVYRGREVVREENSHGMRRPTVRIEESTCMKCQGRGGTSMSCPACNGIGRLRRPGESPDDVIDHLADAIRNKNSEAALGLMDLPSMIHQRFGGFRDEHVASLRQNVAAMIAQGTWPVPERMQTTAETGLTYVRTSGTFDQGGARTLSLGVRGGHWRLISDPLLAPALEVGR
jgi:hypothetical protein